MGYFELGFDDFGAIGSDHYAKLARLDHVAHLAIPKAEMLVAQHKLNAPFLARLQRDALKTFQLFNRPGHAGHQIANVELDHLITRSLARVFNFNTHGQLPTHSRCVAH